MPPRDKNKRLVAGDRGGPILDFEPPEEKKKLPPTHIRASVLDNAYLYAEYINSVKGHKPELDAIIEKALERAFDDDEGFNKFLSARTESSAGASQQGPQSSQAAGADASARTMPEPARRGSTSGGGSPPK